MLNCISLCWYLLCAMTVILLNLINQIKSNQIKIFQWQLKYIQKHHNTDASPHKQWHMALPYIIVHQLLYSKKKSVTLVQVLVGIETKFCGIVHEPFSPSTVWGWVLQLWKCITAAVFLLLHDKLEVNSIWQRHTVPSTMYFIRNV